MKKAIAILVIVSLSAFASQMLVDLPPNAEGTDADWLKYDTGSPGWYTWGGTYRGVWFNTEDFTPGTIGASIDMNEVWFYHDATGHLWDTSDCYLEIWNGDMLAPTAQLDQMMVTAVHYTQQQFTYATPIVVEQNFWLIENVEMSAGGWPSVLGEPIGTVNHSFYSDDNIVWTPWDVPDGIGAYLMGVHADLIPGALDNATWGSLKAAF